MNSKPNPDPGDTRRRRSGAFVVLLAGIVAAALIVAGCGSSGDSTTSGGSTGGEEAGSTSEGGEAAGESASGETVNVAFFGLAAKNVYTNEMYEAMKREEGKLNASVEFFDGEYDGGVQFRQVQDATTSGRFQALIIMPNDAVGIVPAAEEAIEAGLTVSSLEYPLGNNPIAIKPEIEGVTTQVVENVVNAAEETAKQVNDACEGKDPCEVLMLWGNRSSASEQAKEKPFEETLASNVKLVGQADTEFLKEEGRKITEDTLQAHPGLDAIASTGDQMTYGAQEALESAGKTPGTAEGDVTLIGYGASVEGVEEIENGKWLASYVLLPQTMAIKALEVTVAAAQGETIPPKEQGIDQSILSPIGPEATKQSLEKDPTFEGQYPAT